jgi:ribonuclease VapC
MILDTSAIVATIIKEPDELLFRRAMLGAASLAISAVTMLESKIVLRARRGAVAVVTFDGMIVRARIQVVPFDFELAEAAFDAFRRYGKGQGHAAQLNIVDCAAYALANIRGEPLLFKGGDFAKTDVTPAL